MGRWKGLWLGACALLVGSAAFAAPIALVEGKNFRTLTTPVTPETGAKIEVLEAFSYGCVHCFDFESTMRAWRARLPADVQMSYLPATFNPAFELYARGYYAAKALGIAESTHEKVFDTIWKSGMTAQDTGQLTNLYVRLGADRAKFDSALASIGVQAAISAAGVKAERLKLEGTPTLYVDGKYEVMRSAAISDDDILQILDALVVKARAARRAVQK